MEQAITGRATLHLVIIPPVIHAQISNTLVSAVNYTVSVSVQNNGSDMYCPFSLKDSITIFISDTCFKDIRVPTIFTPNGDDVNEVWNFKMPVGTKLNSVYVYNRWETLIYSIDEELLKENTELNTVNWDGHTTSGEECTEGIYFYLIKYTNRFTEQKIIKGNVSLVR